MKKKIDMFHKLPLGIPLCAVERNAYIVDCVKHKNVIDIGFVDEGFLQSRIDSGNWLHSKIRLSAKSVWGFDIDKDSIEFFGGGVNNFYCQDFCKHDAHIKVKDIIGLNSSIDYIICGEIIEHVIDVRMFLNNLRIISDYYKAEIIITAPNVFSYSYGFKNMFCYTFKKVEYVHEDHLCWYSYFTITNLLESNGLKIESVKFTYGKKTFLKKIIYSLLPHLAGSILVKCHADKG